MLKLLCGSVALFACRAAVAYDDGDWQFWNTDSVETKINDRLKTKLETEFYWGDDMSDFYYAHVDLGVYGKVVPWFELGANCRYVREKKQEEWRDEYRPHLNGTFLWAMGPLAMSDRNRVEYRVREAADEGWRYRNRLRASWASKWTRFEIQPYVDDEIFYDFIVNEWNQNRASIGISSKIASPLKADIYYMRQSNRKNGDWTDTNILGLNFKLAF
jgi:hypothetical protein